jgi:peptide/nickel transport system substrate-binding protein
MKARAFHATALGVMAALVLAACSAAGEPADAGSASSQPAQGATLTIGMPNGAQTENHNPFMNTSSAQSLGYAHAMYEPLVQVNPIDPTSEPVPWLAESWEWSEDYTSVTFTVREGVRWSDGEDLTADDVAYSLNLRKDDEALNTFALPFDAVTTEGDVVTVSFTAPQFVNQNKVMNLFVVPEHLWSQKDDPATDVNADPVGTGPYVLQSWTPQAAILVPNDDYWGGEPAVPELRYSSYNDNNALTTALANGDAQWGWTFIADYENVYIAQDPEHHKFWAPAGLAADMLYLNTAEKPFDDPALRRALNMVVDRSAIHSQATSGVFPELTSITGIPTPVGDDFVASELAGQTFEVDVEAAKQVLDDAGYTLDGETLVDPDGTPVTFTLTNPAGWNDYLTSLQIVADAVKPLGIEATVDAANVDAWFDDIANGNFQASMHWTDAGATPWDLYANVMDGAQHRPIGESASWNFGRYQNEEATAALAEFASTSDEQARQQAIETVQRIFVEDVPALAMVARPFAAEYSTRHYVGWPSEDDPYNQPQPTGPQASQILMKLRPAG